MSPVPVDLNALPTLPLTDEPIPQMVDPASRSRNRTHNDVSKNSNVCLSRTTGLTSIAK